MATPVVTFRRGSTYISNISDRKTCYGLVGELAVGGLLFDTLERFVLKDLDFVHLTPRDYMKAVMYWHSRLGRAINPWNGTGPNDRSRPVKCVSVRGGSRRDRGGLPMSGDTSAERRRPYKSEPPRICLTPMSEVTQILSAIEAGDPHAAEQLLPLVYDELRKLAASKLAEEKPGQTLQATALVHEAYLRLVASGDASAPKEQHWNSRGHFFAAAAEAMRRILIGNARRKHAQKRGGEANRVDIDAIELADRPACEKLLALEEALIRLADKDRVKGELVKLRYFAGLTNQEAAAILGISTATADRYWAYARAWLQNEIATSLES